MFQCYIISMFIAEVRWPGWVRFANRFANPLTTNLCFPSVPSKLDMYKAGRTPSENALTQSLCGTALAATLHIVMATASKMPGQVVALLLGGAVLTMSIGSEPVSGQPQPPQCADSATFNDVTGSDCAAWHGYSCAASYDGYTADDMAEVRFNCRFCTLRDVSLVRASTCATLRL